MKTIFKINNREAISIRALPFVTGWMMSPDVVAKAFAHEDHWVTKLIGISAFNLSEDDSYSKVLPKEWDGVVSELENLSNMYQMDESNEGGNYTAWRRESIPLLPQACFVWKDEFEKAFGSAYSIYKLTILDERPGERELNFSPMVPEKLQKIVMQGFEKYLFSMKSIEVVKKPLMTVERESLLRLVIGMAISGYRYDPKSLRNSATTEITNDLEKLGIALDQDTVKKWLIEAASVLPKNY